MKNAIAVAALAVGLAFGLATPSFGGDNVDGGAHPRSGVPTVGEHGANTARGVSRTNPHPEAYGPASETYGHAPEANVKQKHIKKNMK